MTTTSDTTASDTGTTGTDRLDPIFLLAATDPGAMTVLNTELVAGFRAAGGRLGGPFTGVPLLLLSTTGARSRRPCTTPVNYTRTGTGYVIVASKSGAPTHPDWYHNLLAHPAATIEVPGRLLHVRARIVVGAERQRLFDQHAAVLPNFAVYQHRTTRQLPVVILEPC